MTYDFWVDSTLLETQYVAGQKFLRRLSVLRQCVGLIAAPYSGARVGTTVRLAARLGVRAIVPTLSDLHSFDGGKHLDRDSAERFSRAILDGLAPVFDDCLSTHPLN